MNISAPFIRRPIATSLLALAILLAGAAAFTRLPVAPLPRIDIPTISISASLPGASPNTMATAVAMPLERRFGRIAGVTEITSESTLGVTNVTVQFDLDKSVETAAREVQAAIQAAGGDLPPNLPTRPRYRKVNPSDAPILILALRSKTMELSEVYEWANTVFAQKISQVPGVGQVGVGGGVQPAVRVRVDPAHLAGMGLSLEDVRTAMNGATANQPKGSIGNVQSQAISTNSQLIDAAAWQNLIIRWVPPAAGTASFPEIIRLGDIATVTDDVENQRVAGWFDGERSISIQVRRQPGANILEVIERVKALLPELQRSIPPGIEVAVAIDRATTIRSSVHEVELTLVISIILVIVVVFVFLRSLRATAIPAAAVPLSLVATFGAMYVLDYSLDNLSLMALVISTGFVVDDAIVVTENVSRLIDDGMAPREAALKGAKQIGFTIVSITVSLLAVFIPILFMGGAIGRLFREFAVVLAVSITISAVISLTLTPMMCAMLLRPHGESKPRLPARILEGGVNLLVRAYAAALRAVLRHRWITGTVWMATIAATVLLYQRLPSGLFPQQDTGMLNGTSQGPQDISFEAMKAKQEQLIEIVRADPDVAHLNANVGGFGASTQNTARMFIQLRDKPERTASADQIIARLRPKLAKIEGVSLYLQSVQDVRIGGRASRTQYQYTLESASLSDLEEWGPKATAALRKLPELKDVVSDLQTAGLQLDVTVDRDTAARYGITMAQIDQTLYDAFGQRQVATFFTQVNQYRVVLEAGAEGAGPEALDRIFVASSTGAQVPLAQLVKVTPSNVALSVSHQGQFPSTTISFNTAPGVALSQAVAATEKAMLDIGLPASIHGSFAGTARAFSDSADTRTMLILIALGAVYIVLGILYESYVHPITILSTLPSAGLGALLALLVTDSALDLIALVGIILLIGIVKKNAILMIDFALELEREGKGAATAIYEASVLRFRPILMTTLAALLGALPLALGTGTGSELRRPLGIAIVGGLAVSQLLTLFTTPVIYLALHRFTRKRRVEVVAPS